MHTLICVLALSVAAACDSNTGPGASACGSPPCGPISLSEMEINPYPIAATSERVFWVSHSGVTPDQGVLRSVATEGGDVIDVAMVIGASDFEWNDITADSKNVYWRFHTNDGLAEIAMAPVTGGATHTLYTAPTSDTIRGGIALANGALYTIVSNLGLMRIDLQTGNATMIDASANCLQVAAFEQDVYCLSGGITRYAMGVAPPATVENDPAIDVNGTMALVVYASTVYFVSYDDPATESIYAIPSSGGTPSKLAGELQIRSVNFAVNDAGIFWVGGVPGGASFPLMQLSVSGGTPKIATSDGLANFVAANAHDVFLPTYDGTINELAF